MRPEHFFESAWTLQRPTFALKPFIINKANRRGLVPEFLYFAPGESWINYFPGFPWCRFRFDLFRRLWLCKALLLARCAQRQQFGFPQRVVGGGWCVQLLPSPERCCCDLKLCPLSHVFFWQLGDRGNKIKLCFGKRNDASHYDVVFRLCSPCMHTQNWWRLLCSRTDPERCNWRRIWCKNQDLTSIHGLPANQQAMVRHTVYEPQRVFLHILLFRNWGMVYFNRVAAIIFPNAPKTHCPTALPDGKTGHGTAPTWRTTRFGK